jgi:4-amino-4-deoxy-L-arabinose transferase-like glycosyltransferase
MEEPSILDYLKSKLNPWSHEKIDLPETTTDPESLPVSPVQRVDLSFSKPNIGRLPWRSLLTLGFAFSGQFLLEPPAPQPVLAAAFYFVALVFFVWAIWQSEWVIPELREDLPSIDWGAFRRVPLIASFVLGVLAFFFFGGNLFTNLNVSLWLLAIGLFVYSLWVPKVSWREAWQRTRDFFTGDSWSLKITPWLILLVFIWGVAIFFRFSDLNTIPAEPFSDHAEKLLDVYDISQGKTSIFFERNTGREFFQMYLTLAVSSLFGTGLSFFSLKLGTALAGFFTLPYVYLLGKELFNKRVALLALALTAFAYWPNVISRVGLRFPLYPLFAAPVLFYLVRGLRTQNRNDFILSGLFLGLGLHGYSPFRFVPIVVVIAILLYLLHVRNGELRKQTLVLSSVLVLASVFVFLPLLRYTVENPNSFAYRAMTRLAETERPLPDNPLVIFFDNLKNAMLMMNWDNGDIWVHSVMNRPALDVVSAVFFVFGFLILLGRYFRRRDWRDLFLVLCVPLLMMPSIMSLAFPMENPSLNRTGGAYIVVFIIVAFAIDALYQGLKQRGWRQGAVLMITLLITWSAILNYDLVFNQYAWQFRYSAWNTSEIAQVTKSFMTAGNPMKNAWVIPYPYWIDTRLVGTLLGDPNYNPVLWPDQVGETVPLPGNKLFFVKDNDFDSLALLREIYPQGALSYYHAAPGLIGKDFWIFSVPDTSIVPDATLSQP